MCIYEKALQLSIGKSSVHSSDSEICGHNEETENMSIEDSQLPDETAQNNIDLGGILNLASEDTLNIREFFWNIHYIWSLPLKILIIIGMSGLCLAFP